mmetsp:Transcript_54625/g.123480  ORF Transcript_54625/g.123480 Transcript_54625/m.123480 type:complete len:107 (+) Transcript_54625:2-322(+)
MPGMPGMPAQAPGQPQMQPQAAAPAAGPITAAALANAPPDMRKKMLGEKLFAQVFRYEPQMAGKITGMLLEMDDSELLSLLDSEATLHAKVVEAKGVLNRVQKAPA